MNEVITTELHAYLAKLCRIELKAMYSLDIDDAAFGVETDLYRLAHGVLQNTISPASCCAQLYSSYSTDACMLKIADDINKLRRYDV